ncbi:hypothetical protein MYSTI_02065 [Myxococcus stipitatus DSM 14675]|uniref:Lipoprotein n=1 Tax=Myxococcus stipitatus (strain DSM 14675 / JCM 12634 / Mx s8) TaxID=1278073 RepID=L7UAC9_MYXSD|nr:nuclear transport factor 2 family protein [Myxococcus stipitatus]AGC43394.1 hypothetical protein MYSTI_02065 [Myxococcus stipitatus DSM 14675]
MRRALPIGFALVCLASVAHAQQLSEAAESEAITRTALNYAEGWYEGDGAKMASSLHPELAKRIVQKDAEGRAELGQMSALALRDATAAGSGTGTPPERRFKDVRILEASANTAHVRVEMSDWIDYMQMARWNGQWKILNVLWELKPKQAPAVVDEAALKRTVLDYVDGLFSGDTWHMERALHPDLVRRTVTVLASGRSKLRSQSAMTLWLLSREGGCGEAGHGRRPRREVVLLDAFENIAFLKVQTADTVEYLHVARWSGQWKVVSVLWEPRAE